MKWDYGMICKYCYIIAYMADFSFFICTDIRGYISVRGEGGLQNEHIFLQARSNISGDDKLIIHSQSPKFLLLHKPYN